MDKNVLEISAKDTTWKMGRHYDLPRYLSQDLAVSIL